MDQLYYEEGYIAQGYYVYIAEASAGFGPYIAEGYLPTDFFEDRGSFAALTCIAQIVVGQEVLANGAWSSNFSLTVGISKLVSASVDLNSNFSQTTVATKNSDIDLFAFSDAAISIQVQRLRDNNITASSAFTIAIDGARVRYIDSAEDALFDFSVINQRSRATSLNAQAAFSLTAIVDGTTDEVSANLVSTASVNAVVGLIKSFNSNVQSTASMIALPRILVRNTQIVANSGDIYNNHVINTSSKQFGAGSLSWNIGSAVYPTSNIVWTGTVFKTFTTGFTWTSTDGLTWTRTTNNLSYTNTTPKISFVNARYCYLNGNTLQYSTDGDSWSTSTITNASGFTGGNFQEVFYVNGAWRVFRGGVLTTRYQIRVFTSTNLTTWTNTELLNEGTVGDLAIEDITQQGSLVVISYWTVNFPNFTSRQTSWNGITFTGWSTIVTSTTLTVERGAWDGNVTFVAAFYNNSASHTSRIYVRVNTTVTNYNITGVVSDVNFVNGRWFISTNIGVYSGTDPNNLTLVDSVANQRVIFGSSRYLSYQQLVNENLITGREFIRHSTNATSWSNDQVENISGVPGRIVYSRGDNTDLGNFSTVDFWVNVVDQFRVNSVPFEIFENANRYLIVSVFSDTGGVGNNIVTITKFYDGLGSFLQVRNLPYGWNHIRLVQSGSTARLFVNGVSSGGLHTWVVNDWPTGQIAGSVRLNNGVHGIDELLFTDSQLSLVTDTTCVVPTKVWENTDTTDLLLHFDSDLSDDSRFVVVPSAGLTAVAQVSVIAGVNYKSSANITANSSLVCLGQKSVEIILSAFGNAALTVQALRIQQSAVSIESQSSLSSAVIKLTDITSNQSSTTAVDAQAVVTRNAQIATEAVGTQLTAVVRLAGLFVDDLVTATLSVNPVVTRSAVSSQSSSATVSANNFRVRFNSITLASEFASDVQGFVGIVGSSNMSAQFAQTTAPNRFRDNTVALNAASELSATGNNLGKIEGSLFNAVTMTTVAVKITSANATTNTTAAVAANTDISLTKTYQSAITASFTSLCNAEKRVGTFAFLTAFASNLTVAVKQTVTDLDVEVISAMSVSAVKTARTSANFANTTTQSTVAVKTARAISSQSSNFAQTTTAIKAVFGYADLSVLAFELAAAVKTAGISINTNTTATMTVSAVKTARANSSLNSTATVVAPMRRIRTARSTINSNFTQTSRIGFLASAQITIASAMTFVSEVREIRIDEIVYVIPGEIWVYEITSETRLHSIGSESREYIIT